MARWFGYRDGYEDLIKIFMPEDQILWFDSVNKLEENLRKDFEENNSDDSKILPRDAVIKMAYHTPENLFLKSKLLKKFPSICDPNKLKHTRIQELSFFGTTKSKKIINNLKIQNQNTLKVKDFILKIQNDKEAILFNNNTIPSVIKNYNINYLNVSYQLVIEFLQNQISHAELQPDINALISFILANSK